MSFAQTDRQVGRQTGSTHSPVLLREEVGSVVQPFLLQGERQPLVHRHHNNTGASPGPVPSRSGEKTQTHHHGYGNKDLVLISLGSDLTGSALTPTIEALNLTLVPRIYRNVEV
ncbi:hypothetical protein EYF80_002542 [Liparis tanakae]|uniref:Uncharacterized protein n=1 Tax=Liparis tanakae TaxID=230148 RepID=A0A4Z2JBG8_9TELE|nr:hypothetical protein EYF80_002542 [Liparis tanakae]